MSHTCHAEGCSVRVPPKMFSCARHWRMVPSWLQDTLWRVYRPGQEKDKLASTLYCLVQTRCRIAIAVKEKRSTTALYAELRRWFALEFHDDRETVDASLSLDDGMFLEAVDMAMKGVDR